MPQNALPWFPLTADYIDTYNDSVLKYLRDALQSSQDPADEDSSYATTRRLLGQRAAQVADDAVRTTLADALARRKDEATAASLARDMKVAATEALIRCREHTDARSEFRLLCYFLAVLYPECADTLSEIFCRCLHAKEIGSVGYTIDNIIDFDVPSFLKAMSNAEMSVSDEICWFEGHGTLRVCPERIAVYDKPRRLLQFMQPASSRTVLSSPREGIVVLEDRQEARQGFLLGRYVRSCEHVVPGGAEQAVLKDYTNGDRLTVKITGKGYDSLLAVSTDSAYNRLERNIRITGGGDNVCGIYMNHLAEALFVGSCINVEYDETQDCFSIDGTIIDFIYEKYWLEDEATGSTYEKTDAILLFPARGQIMNTWLTREGFLVRTGYENLPRNSFRILEIVDYDSASKYILAKVSDEELIDGPFDCNEVRRQFLNELKGYCNANAIMTAPEPERPEIRIIAAPDVAFLHRLLALKWRIASSKPAEKIESLSLAEILATLSGNQEDRCYYGILRGYVERAVLFARKKFDKLTPLDSQECSHFAGTDLLVRLTEVLASYGGDDEADAVVAGLKDEDETIRTIAELVQAANRFKSIQSLENLRIDLHREICVMLGVSDSIEAASDAGDDADFPFLPEGENIEHKMSWVFDNDTGEFNETAQSAKCMKTICAFMNRYKEQGDSHLYIGTDEARRRINGFDADISALADKGELDASKGDPGDAYLRHVMGMISKAFPDTYQNVSPARVCDGRVLDLCVHPASEGVVYFHGTAYYRQGSSSRQMNPAIADEISNRKLLMRSDIVDKIESVRKAVSMKRAVLLVGYDSSNSNTEGVDRKLEVYAFTDDKRLDSVWAFDPKDRKNKVFRLRRCDAVKILDEGWKNENLHQARPLDIFGISGNESIEVSVLLKNVMVKNLLTEMYPDVAVSLELVGDRQWRLHAFLRSDRSLETLCSFCLAYASDLDFSGCELLKQRLRARLEGLLEELV